MTRQTSRTGSAQFDALESRICRSTSVAFVDGTLTINGDGAADAMVFRYVGDDTLEIQTDDSAAFTQTGVRNLIVNTGSGDDYVRFETNGQDLAFAPESLTFTLGAGDDRLDVTMADPSLTSSVALTSDGGDGDDQFHVLIDNAELLDHPALSLGVTLNGDAGNDSFNVDIDAPSLLGESQVPVPPIIHLAADGGAGNDNARILLGRSPSFDAFFDGGDGYDTLVRTAATRALNVERDMLVRQLILETSSQLIHSVDVPA